MEKNTHKEIVNIKREVKDLRETVDFLLLRPDNPIEYVTHVLGRSEDRVRVFLAINGRDSLREIAKKLPGVNVPRCSKYLEKKKLIYKLDVPGRSFVYRKPHWAHVLNIDEIVREDYGITNDE
ncbi:hypothetical protein IBX38_07520 [Candidatus Bathyarchaeota archaeon]|nr:hypothetical protein [Candidatus Bathyarchaeota archaeon]